MFYCDKCGLCCKMLNLFELPPEFKFLKSYDDGTGKCEFLKNNLCIKYEDRPDICNSKILYEKFYKEKMSKEEYSKLMKNECKKIKKIYKNLENNK